jgi:hypothetical protein
MTVTSSSCRSFFRRLSRLSGRGARSLTGTNCEPMRQSVWTNCVLLLGAQDRGLAVLAVHQIEPVDVGPVVPPRPLPDVGDRQRGVAAEVFAELAVLARPARIVPPRRRSARRRRSRSSPASCPRCGPASHEIARIGILPSGEEIGFFSVTGASLMTRGFASRRKPHGTNGSFGRTGSGSKLWRAWSISSQASSLTHTGSASSRRLEVDARQHPGVEALLGIVLAVHVVHEAREVVRPDVGPVPLDQPHLRVHRVLHRE